MANKYVALFASRFSSVNTAVGPFDSKEAAENFLYKHGINRELYTKVVRVESPDEYECGRCNRPSVG